MRALLISGAVLLASVAPAAQRTVTYDGNSGCEGLGGYHHRSGTVICRGGPVMIGSGNVTRQPRRVAQFSSVRADGAVDVEIAIGNGYAVEVEADDNLLNLISTEVDGGTLFLDSRGSFTAARGPRVRITMPRLDAVHLASSSDAVLHGLRGGAVRLSSTGSGDFTADGALDRVEAKINGSGDLHFRQLRVRDASVVINGSGDALLNATQSIHATVNGSGDIRYLGDPPVVRLSAHGSGSIERTN